MKIINNKWNITKEFLVEEYQTKKKSFLIISKEKHIPYETLYWYKKKFGIVTHPPNMWLKGQHTSPKTEFKKGAIPWNKNKKGVTKSWNKGKKLSKEYIQKIVESTRKAMSKPEIKSKIIKTQFKKGITPWNKNRTGVYSKNTIEKIRTARLRQIIPKRNTNPELILFRILTELNLSFKKHIPIKNICQADAFVEPNIVLFADGDYWHANPSFYKVPITIAQVKNIERDKRENSNLIKENYVIIRFWEYDLINNKDHCKKIIQKIIE